MPNCTQQMSVLAAQHGLYLCNKHFEDMNSVKPAAGLCGVPECGREAAIEMIPTGLEVCEPCFRAIAANSARLTEQEWVGFHRRLSGPEPVGRTTIRLPVLEVWCCGLFATTFLEGVFGLGLTGFLLKQDRQAAKINYCPFCGAKVVYHGE